MVAPPRSAAGRKPLTEIHAVAGYQTGIWRTGEAQIMVANGRAFVENAHAPALHR